MKDDIRNLKDLAAELAGAGKLDQAAAVYEGLVALAPTDPYLLQKRGELLAAQGRRIEAIADFQQVAHIYARQGHLLRSIAACRVILSIDPTHEDTLNAIAAFFALRGDTVPPPPVATSAASPTATATAPSTAPQRLLPPIPLFTGLPREAFAALVAGLEIRKVRAGGTIVREGEIGAEMFVLVRGSARVVHVVDGRRRVVDELRERSFFGEIALLFDAPRLATIEAASTVELLVLPRATLDALVEKHPTIGESVRRFCQNRLFANVLRAAPRLRALPERSRRAMLEDMEIRTFDAGEILLQQGVRGQSFHLLLRGTATVAHAAANGEELIYPDLVEGDVFGEISLLLGTAASATVQAKTRSVVLTLSRASFEKAIGAGPARAHVEELRDRRIAATKATHQAHRIPVDAALRCA